MPQSDIKRDSLWAKMGSTGLWAFGFLFSVGFMVIIWILTPYLDRFLSLLLPDQGASWYFWKLPTREFWSVFTAWAFYLANQFAVWGLIFWAQKTYTERKTNPTRDLTKYNLYITLVSVLFAFLHLLQTQLWFDGLAQDVPIITSQGSVIVMLAIILIIENQRRGLFVGKKVGRPFTASVTGFFRHYHMYIFAWALVYTFWFHPMVGDPQLLTGFLYMFLLFTQMWLAYTTVHLNKKWIIFLEGFVGIHAVVVAVYNSLYHGSAQIWPLFLTGFAFMFVFTYAYALNLKKIHYWIIAIAYVLATVFIYLPAPFGLDMGLTNLLRLQPLWIPLILYGLAFGFAGVTYFIQKRRSNPKANK